MEAGPSTAPAAAPTTAVYTKAILSLTDLQFSDADKRVLVTPLPVRSKKQLARVMALGKFISNEPDAVPIGFQSSFVYFDWMNPTTGRLVPYLTTVLDDGSYETRADQAPQNKKRFHGKTVTGAWVALTKEINKQMPDDAIKRRTNLAFRDFLGLNSEVLKHIFDQMKAIDLGLEPPAAPPTLTEVPPHLDPSTYADNDYAEMEEDGKRMGAGGRMFRVKANKKKGSAGPTVMGEDGVAIVEVKKKRRRKPKEVEKEGVGGGGGVVDAASAKPPKPKILISDPNIRPRKWTRQPLHIKTISGSSIVLGGWFTNQKRQVTSSAAKFVMNTEA